MKIRIWIQPALENQRTDSLCNRSGGKKCERTKKLRFSGQICSKCLSRSNSESEGLTGKLQLTFLHDLGQRTQRKNSERVTFFPPKSASNGSRSQEYATGMMARR